jgi:transcriptional regulator with XRE-family HTH domain
MTERNNRIRKAIDTKSSQQKLAERLGITRQAVNLRLSAEKDIDSIDFINAVADLTGYSIKFLIEGKGQGNEVNEADIDYEKTLPKSRGEFYTELVEANSEYSLIPKSFINGDYRIMLKSELEEMNKTREKLIQSKDKSISLLEKRIEDLERLVAVTQRVQK